MTAPALEMSAIESDEPGEPQDVIDDVASMRTWCREQGHVLLGHDERVTEPAAAAVLGYAPETLRHWRQSGGGPPFFRVRGRVSYRLTDLATWLAAERAADGDEI